MALFKSSNPEKVLQREIDAANANRERVSTRLAECKQAVARHSATAKESALTGDDAGLDAAEASFRAAQDRAVSLGSALAAVEQQIVNLERSKAEMLDRKLRSETAAEIELLARKLTEIGAEFNGTAERLSEQTRLAVPLVYEALGLDNFTKLCLAEVPQTLDMIGKLLRAHADAVIAGMAPATMPRPDDAPAEVPAPAQPSPHFTYRPVTEGKPTFKGHVVG